MAIFVLICYLSSRICCDGHLLQVYTFKKTSFIMVTCRHAALILKHSSVLQWGIPSTWQCRQIAAFILKAPTGSVAARHVQLAHVPWREPAFVHSRWNQSRSAGFKCLSGSLVLTLGSVAGKKPQIGRRLRCICPELCADCGGLQPERGGGI